ncbi:hypothetical protein HDU93_007325 [Gonapodya sp. JEL0774]|nr:hypothetical protein HDU93_007325 [Gonapodya sp. JEL0774]
MASLAKTLNDGVRGKERAAEEKRDRKRNRQTEEANSRIPDLLKALRPHVQDAVRRASSDRAVRARFREEWSKNQPTRRTSDPQANVALLMELLAALEEAHEKIAKSIPPGVVASFLGPLAPSLLDLALLDSQDALTLPSATFYLKSNALKELSQEPSSNQHERSHFRGAGHLIESLADPPFPNSLPFYDPSEWYELMKDCEGEEDSDQTRQGRVYASFYIRQLSMPLTKAATDISTYHNLFPADSAFALTMSRTIASTVSTDSDGRSSFFRFLYAGKTCRSDGETRGEADLTAESKVRFVNFVKISLKDPVPVTTNTATALGGNHVMREQVDSHQETGRGVSQLLSVPDIDSISLALDGTENGMETQDLVVPEEESKNTDSEDGELEHAELELEVEAPLPSVPAVTVLRFEVPSFARDDPDQLPWIAHLEQALILLSADRSLNSAVGGDSRNLRISDNTVALIMDSAPKIAKLWAEAKKGLDDSYFQRGRQSLLGRLYQEFGRNGENILAGLPSWARKACGPLGLELVASQMAETATVVDGRVTQLRVGKDVTVNALALNTPFDHPCGGIGPNIAREIQLLIHVCQLDEETEKIDVNQQPPKVSLEHRQISQEALHRSPFIFPPFMDFFCTLVHFALIFFWTLLFRRRLSVLCPVSVHVMGETPIAAAFNGMTKLEGLDEAAVDELAKLSGSSLRDDRKVPARTRVITATKGNTGFRKFGTSILTVAGQTYMWQFGTKDSDWTILVPNIHPGKMKHDPTLAHLELQLYAVVSLLAAYLDAYAAVVLCRRVKSRMLERSCPNNITASEPDDVPINKSILRDIISGFERLPDVDQVRVVLEDMRSELQAWTEAILSLRFLSASHRGKLGGVNEFDWNVGTSLGEQLDEHCGVAGAPRTIPSRPTISTVNSLSPSLPLSEISSPVTAVTSPTWDDSPGQSASPTAILGARPPFTRACNPAILPVKANGAPFSSTRMLDLQAHIGAFEASGGRSRGAWDGIPLVPPHIPSWGAITPHDEEYRFWILSLPTGTTYFRSANGLCQNELSQPDNTTNHRVQREFDFAPDELPASKRTKKDKESTPSQYVRQQQTRTAGACANPTSPRYHQFFLGAILKLTQRQYLQGDRSRWKFYRWTVDPECSFAYLQRSETQAETTHTCLEEKERSGEGLPYNLVYYPHDVRILSHVRLHFLPEFSRFGYRTAKEVFPKGSQAWHSLGPEFTALAHVFPNASILTDTTRLVNDFDREQMLDLLIQLMPTGGRPTLMLTNAAPQLEVRNLDAQLTQLLPNAELRAEGKQLSEILNFLVSPDGVVVQVKCSVCPRIVFRGDCKKNINSKPKFFQCKKGIPEHGRTKSPIMREIPGTRTSSVWDLPMPWVLEIYRIHVNASDKLNGVVKDHDLFTA